MRDPSVVVTGMGLVSALGCGVDAAWRSMQAGATGLGALTLFASPRCGHFPVGQVRDDLVALGAPVDASRADRMVFLAVREALSAARLADAPAALRAGAGFVLGATVGGLPESEGVLDGLVREGALRPGQVRHHEMACSIDLCAESFGLLGPCLVISTACSSGAMAIAAAGDLIEAGEADVVLAAGADVLCGLTLSGFGSLLLLDPAGCRPFDAARAGLSLGEGAAALVLESASSARRRGAPVLARLAGWGRSCDAHHMTAPDPAGRGAAAALRDALRCAGLGPGDIGYVNAHGTGTRDNDPAEARALREVFGGRLPPFSSSKGYFGHTLAASGAIEAVVSVLALRDGLLPPSPGFAATDPEIGLEPIRRFEASAVRHVLSNSFGFGGNNAALVFSRADEPDRGASPAARRPSVAIPVVGLGAIGPAGATPGEAFETARGGGASPSVREIGPPFPAGREAVCACREIPEASRLPPSRRRRLSRLLEMTILAAREAARSAPGVLPDDRAVLIGSGLGCLADTVEFLVNRIRNDERNPMPARFVNSVHNALSAQTAIDLGARRMNGTTVQREVSFEAALWQARRLIDRGEALGALVGAADELHDGVIAVRRGGRDRADAARPDASPGAGPSGPEALFGEGAAVIALEGAGGGDRPLAWVSGIALGRYRRDERVAGASGAACRWIEDRLARDGVAPADLDLVLTGAAAGGRLVAMYDAVAEGLRSRARRPLPQGRYKHLCGDYCAASAFGFIVAVGLVTGRMDPSAVRATPAADRPVRNVLLLTLGRGGEMGMCCVRGDER